LPCDNKGNLEQDKMINLDKMNYEIISSFDDAFQYLKNNIFY